MYRPLSLACATLVVSLALCAPAFSGQQPGAGTPTAAPAGSAPPEIYRVVSRPLCTELHAHVLPAIALVLQNDRAIAKSLPIFKDYTATAFMNNAKTPDDTTDYDSPGRSMALERMYQLVGPLAHNVIALQKMLENTSLAVPSGKAEDDKQLKDIRQKLLKVLGSQSSSLDIINGFVETQRLGDIQHANEEYLSSIQKPDVVSTPSVGTTPNPLLQDTNQPGLAPNPFMIDPAAIPGLQVGYNPLSRILDAFGWLRDETAKREDSASQSVVAAGIVCGYRFGNQSPNRPAAPTPAPSPSGR